MYDMYNYPESITQRASEAELRRWEQEGALDCEPSDWVAARQVEVAARAMHENTAVLAGRVSVQLTTRRG